MDTPFAATVHKKNVHVGGGKTFTMRKPIKLKLAGKRRKPLADFRDTYAPSSGVSNDVDLKPMTHGKQQIEWADLIPVEWGIPNEAFKKCYEWALEQDIDEMDCSTWSFLEDEEPHYSPPPTMFIQPLSDDPGLHSPKSYEIEDPDFDSPKRLGPRLHKLQELDEFFAAARQVVRNTKMEFKVYFGLDNDKQIGGKEREVCALAELENDFANIITES